MRAILCLQPGGSTVGGPPGVFYRDLSSTGTWAGARAAAEALLLGLEAAAEYMPTRRATYTAGLAPGRFPARCAASLAAPGTVRILPDGEPGLGTSGSPRRDIAAALAPLSLNLLPGLAPAQLRTLHELRIFTLGELAAIPTPVLSAVCGSKMPALQALARGEDSSPVARPRYISPRMAAYTPVPVQARADAILLLLDSLVADLAARLAEEGQAAREITLTVGFAHEVVAERHSGSSLSRKVRVAPPATHAAELRSSAAPLLGSLLRARRLRPAWLELVASRCCQAAYQPFLPGIGL